MMADAILEQNAIHLIGAGIPLIAMVPGVKEAPLQKAEFLFLRISHLFFPTTGPPAWPADSRTLLHLSRERMNRLTSS